MLGLLVKRATIVRVYLRCFDSRLRLLLKGIDHPYRCTKLHSVNGAMALPWRLIAVSNTPPFAPLKGFAVSALGCSRLHTGLDLGADLVARHFQVVGSLHADPEFGAGAKITREP